MALNSKKIIVTDISSSASEKTVKDFFLFCGKIKEFELIKEESSDKQIAYVTFERDTASKTALMLTNAVIGDCQITVKSADDTSCGDEIYDGSGLSQEDKPKSLILAEILAAGYQLQDAIITKGIEFDAKYGFSKKLMHYVEQITANLKSLDEKYKFYETVTAKANEINHKYSVQDKFLYTASQLQDKVNQAIETSTGKMVFDYYIYTAKSVEGVRASARHIADQKKSRVETNAIAVTN